MLPLKFLEVNQENNKLVVSNRRAVVENSMTEIKRGDVVSGIVKVRIMRTVLMICIFRQVFLLNFEWPNLLHRFFPFLYPW